MAEPAADYHRGEMDIHEQTNTYHGFLSVSKWVSLGLAAFILFLVMMFCTSAGFLGSAIAAIAVAVIGVIVLREKPNQAH